MGTHYKHLSCEERTMALKTACQAPGWRTDLR